AFEGVRLTSPEMNIRDAEHLTARFSDMPPVGVLLPETLPVSEGSPNAPAKATPPATPSLAAPAGASAPSGGNAPEGTPPPPGPAAAAPVAGANRLDATPAVQTRPVPTAPAAQEPKKERKPIDLWARTVSAYVNRAGEKNELHEVVAEGTVKVHQDGNTPEDKGVDIKGETLNLVRHAAGDTLVVFGDVRAPGQLQLGE